MESQVLRPMRTALRGFFSLRLEAPCSGRDVGDVCVDGGDTWGGTRFVTLAKKARSALRVGQGREPRKPMPKAGVVATMRVRGGSGGGMDGDGSDDVNVMIVR